MKGGLVLVAQLQSSHSQPSQSQSSKCCSPTTQNNVLLHQVNAQSFSASRAATQLGYTTRGTPTVRALLRTECAWGDAWMAGHQQPHALAILSSNQKQLPRTALPRRVALQPVATTVVATTVVEETFRLRQTPLLKNTPPQTPPQRGARCNDGAAAALKGLSTPDAHQSSSCRLVFCCCLGRFRRCARHA